MKHWCSTGFEKYKCIIRRKYPRALWESLSSVWDTALVACSALAPQALRVRAQLFSIWRWKLLVELGVPPAWLVQGQCWQWGAVAACALINEESNVWGLSKKNVEEIQSRRKTTELWSHLFPHHLLTPQSSLSVFLYFLLFFHFFIIFLQTPAWLNLLFSHSSSALCSLFLIAIPSS